MKEVRRRSARIDGGCNYTDVPVVYIVADAAPTPAAAAAPQLPPAPPASPQLPLLSLLLLVTQLLSHSTAAPSVAAAAAPHAAAAPAATVMSSVLLPFAAARAKILKGNWSSFSEME